MTPTIDTRTAAERRYDDLKSGAAYVKAQPAEQQYDDIWPEMLGIITDATNDGRADTPLSSIERAAIVALFPSLAAVEPAEDTDLAEILAAIDGGE